MNAKVAGVLGCVAAACICAAQDSDLHMTFENYWLAQPSTRGLGERLCWIQLTDDFTPHLSVTNTYLLMPSRDLLDETYVKYTSGLTEVRAGRFRSGFGISEWSDYYYNAIIALPIVRFNRLQPYLGLTRFDTGLDVRSIVGPVEYQVGMVDTDSGAWQWAPKNPDFGVARLQTHFGALIVGASALGRVAGSKDEDDTEAYGVDFRWTADHLQMRGELVRLHSGDGWSGGYYVDAFLRPPGLYRTQVGVRAQAVDSLAGAVSQTYTVGVRQIVTPNLSATLNYGTGSGPASKSLSGWSFEISTTFHF
ncbi:MAG TPA: hypothetical protein VG820_10775 [Fimbriimonadaceae bacterium]|nr:hypothetical protein [Fimbriimonadaceae bacterium]